MPVARALHLLSGKVIVRSELHELTQCVWTSDVREKLEATAEVVRETAQAFSGSGVTYEPSLWQCSVEFRVPGWPWRNKETCSSLNELTFSLPKRFLLVHGSQLFE